MYAVGEYVVYGIHGVCRVLEIQKQRVNGKEIEYLVLSPAEQSVDRYFVPMHNPTVMGKLRPILSKKQLQQLLTSEQIREDAWIPDENLRKQAYRELITSGDRLALIRMVGALLRHRKTQQETGRKFHQADENFLRDAQKLVSGEFALVLGIAPEQVGEYILSSLGTE